MAKSKGPLVLVLLAILALALAGCGRGPQDNSATVSSVPATKPAIVTTTVTTPPPSTTTVSYIPAPRLVSPAPEAVMDNGCSGGKDGIVWDFDWADVAGAERYELYVKGSGASYPMIDTLTSTSSYHEASQGYITDFNRYGWGWRVRAQVNGRWGEWSETRSFDVEPLNTDLSDVTTPPVTTTPVAHVVKTYTTPT